jgi:hypothetical protein
MYHSVTFGEKNTWDDWHIVPSTRPVFAPPSVKTKTVDIPGGDGLIDLSESLTGYPVYNNREGSMEFIVVNNSYDIVDDQYAWYDVYSTIMDYLHGQQLIARLEDDKNYFYRGRFSVSDWKSDKSYSTITIDYNVEPYKWNNQKSTDDWLWDPFSFKTGVIKTKKWKDIALTTAYTTKTITSDFFERAPVCPTFSISTTGKQGASVQLVNKTLGTTVTKTLSEGDTQDPDYIIYGSEITLSIKAISGTGTASVVFNPGRL